MRPWQEQLGWAVGEEQQVVQREALRWASVPGVQLSPVVAVGHWELVLGEWQNVVWELGLVAEQG